MKTKTTNSMLIQGDSRTEATYKRNGFNPEKGVNHFSYTSSRVAKRVYNRYEPIAGTDFSVCGYYPNWAQYDDRPDKPLASNDKCGWGVDLTLLDANAYDKVIVDFLGVVGDQGKKRASSKLRPVVSITLAIRRP
ncbi:MAG: hypothetical protein K2Q15_12225 [Burkholderiales bacterium]|nr:hypothetical protein [Burkholderiales bacterium]